jgi:threonine dehydrogenase-like Zn-dependent dehydrogenase
MSFSRRMKAQHMLRAIEVVDNGTVSLEGIISSTYPLAEAARGFEELVARSGLKIVVKPTA